MASETVLSSFKWKTFNWLKALSLISSSGDSSNLTITSPSNVEVVSISNESTILLKPYPVLKIDGETLVAFLVVKPLRVINFENLMATLLILSLTLPVFAVKDLVLMTTDGVAVVVAVDWDNRGGCGGCGGGGDSCESLQMALIRNWSHRDT